MALSRAEVEHVAHLARLDLSEAERERLQEQLSSILDQFEALRELDTESIPPTAQVITLVNVLRDDQPRPSLSPAEALQNAPHREDDYFRVKAVLES